MFFFLVLLPMSRDTFTLRTESIVIKTVSNWNLLNWRVTKSRNSQKKTKHYSDVEVKVEIEVESKRLLLCDEIHLNKNKPKKIHKFKNFSNSSRSRFDFLFITFGFSFGLSFLSVALHWDGIRSFLSMVRSKWWMRHEIREEEKPTSTVSNKRTSVIQADQTTEFQFRSEKLNGKEHRIYTTTKKKKNTEQPTKNVNKMKIFRWLFSLCFVRWILMRCILFEHGQICRSSSSRTSNNNNGHNHNHVATFFCALCLHSTWNFFFVD